MLALGYAAKGMFNLAKCILNLITLYGTGIALGVIANIIKYNWQPSNKYDIYGIAALVGLNILYNRKSSPVIFLFGYLSPDILKLCLRGLAQWVK